MTEPKPASHLVLINIASSVVVAIIVAMVAYWGTSTTVSGTLDIRLSTIEVEVVRLRNAMESANSKRVIDLEAKVLILESQLRELRETRFKGD